MPGDSQTFFVADREGFALRREVCRKTANPVACLDGPWVARCPGKAPGDSFMRSISYQTASRTGELSRRGDLLKECLPLVKVK